ncbi:MAG: NUDIX hydrolase [Clostridia bacterium]|nr:NUDIX hydrolase [Clostridia bacterium]
MSQFEEKQIERKEIYDGAVLHVVKDKVLLPNGEESIREFCLHKGAVAVIPIDNNDEVIMVRQFRYAHHREFLEIPAGKLDFIGEDPLDAAKRELSEETGAMAERITPLGILDTTPALIDEIIHLYMAEGLSFGNMHPDEDEFLEVVRYPLKDLVNMVMHGEIRDGKTQIAILKAAIIKKMI